METENIIHLQRIRIWWQETSEAKLNYAGWRAMLTVVIGLVFSWDVIIEI